MSLHKEQQLIAIIQLLGQGEFYSGQAIADNLGVSRAYVWKLIQQLQDLGLGIQSVTGKGYRLEHLVELLDGQEIQQLLMAHDIDLRLVTDSTNEALKGEGFAHNRLVIAEYQSAGRGRRGRRWVSPLASNLYWSLGWKTQLPVQQLGGLSLVVGLAIVEALRQLEVTGVELKWPNDIRFQGRKLGGILIELSGDMVGGLQVIIGVGLNVHMSDRVTETIEQDWMNLQELKSGISRQEVLVEIIRQLGVYLEQFEKQGFHTFLDEWQKVDECYNQKVSIIQGDETINGCGAGVDENGAFLLQTGKGMKPVYAGEVSLRLR
ncbi:bifunctional biotin--[acetyl-CoA-carboxylase] ligase/biotin operon repressor BirA [Kangiella sediminilitoris]|uniref:Bifunctional ligase/repressor BirA n=1 Tax=Kangiella sediminilitoris TaxID=1144748 RepID=A0A1B3BD30_9GAMM|nr:bifunctional biotin--[acetyl-CoA-carboxylase] ligase/biotin operon repressor BirA [Kangiella sediminilitoris]AOE50712.1 Biotin/acetyl-CoA-carboxylase ligase [Kangiella sediminilitoris]